MAVVYGIDTGSWKVRIAAMEGSFGRFALRDVVELVPTIAEDGAVDPAPAFAAFATSEPGWLNGDRAAAWPVDQGVVRLVRLPFVDKQAIARALPAEVESQVPYDLDDMVLATRILEAKDGQSRTVAYIVPRDDLRARLDALKGAGAEPKTMPFDVAALATYADRGVQAIIDVGHRRTVLAYCQAGQIVGAHAIPVAGAAMTGAISRATGLDWAAAEAQKHTTRVPPHPDDATAEWEGDRTDTQIGRVSPEAPIAAIAARAVREAAEEWVADIRAGLITLEEETGLGLDEVLLCGGGARMEGLGEILASHLGVPARPVAVPGGYPIDCALSVALARVAAGDVKATDLRQDAFAYHGHAETLWNVVSYATVGAVVALVAGVSMGAFQIWDATQRQADLEQQISDSVLAAFPDLPAERLADPTMAVALLKERVTETSARVDALGSTVSGVPPTLDMLKLLSERLPPHKEARIDVRELNFSEVALSMKAETDSYESAAKIEESIIKEKRFSEAKKSDEKKVGDALTFSLTIPFEGAAESAGEDG